MTFWPRSFQNMAQQFWVAGIEPDAAALHKSADNTAKRHNKQLPQLLST